MGGIRLPAKNTVGIFLQMGDVKIFGDLKEMKVITVGTNFTEQCSGRR